MPGKLTHLGFENQHHCWMGATRIGHIQITGREVWTFESDSGHGHPGGADEGFVDRGNCTASLIQGSNTMRMTSDGTLSITRVGSTSDAHTRIDDCEARPKIGSFVRIVMELALPSLMASGLSGERVINLPELDIEFMGGDVTVKHGTQVFSIVDSNPGRSLAAEDQLDGSTADRLIGDDS